MAELLESLGELQRAPESPGELQTGAPERTGEDFRALRGDVPRALLRSESCREPPQSSGQSCRTPDGFM
eukprot:9663209-Alexandrium_andersonii.AAC.1